MFLCAGGLMMLPIDRRAFFDGYRKAFGPLTQSQVDGLNALLHSIETDDGLADDDICPVAYMLATVKHECADTWQPIDERGPRPYFDPYEPGTETARRLGNTEPGDGYRFRGRGYVQLTGRSNYARMADILGDKVGNLVLMPSLALIPAVAYAIMSVGMRGGLFTGKELGDYCGGYSHDYVGARRVINGTDCCDKIASYARVFEKILNAATATEAEDERQAIPTPLPSQIPTPPIFVPPPPKVTPPVRHGFWRKVFGGA